MANRIKTQFMHSLEKRIIKIYASVKFGTSGAPTLIIQNSTALSGYSKGIQSVTRVAAGEYKFVFGRNIVEGNAPYDGDVYFNLKALNVLFQTGTTTIPAAPISNLAVNNLSTIRVDAGTVQLYAAGGAPADPASGEIGRFEFVFADSTAQ